MAAGKEEVKDMVIQQGNGRYRQGAVLSITITAIIATVSITAGPLSGFTNECLARPVWDSVYEDRIGSDDASHAEFGDLSYGNEAVIDYRVGDDWIRFPCRLNTRQHTPHTVNILFETSWADGGAWSLVLAASAIDSPVSQRLGVCFDGYPVHPPGGEEIQPGTFQEHIFWLGYIAPGRHRITLSNETDPNSLENPGDNYGTYFDYLKLVPGSRIGLFLAADTNAAVALTGFTALAANDPAISGSGPPKANFYAGYWKFTITGLEPAGSVKIEIHCPPESFFPLQKYYSYGGPAQGWRSLAASSMDQARSIVTVTLSDGGPGDGDTTPDGSISHTGGIAVPVSLGEGYDYQGCFISSLKQGQASSGQVIDGRKNLLFRLLPGVRWYNGDVIRKCK